jgi:hypothetical protein
MKGVAVMLTRIALDIDVTDSVRLRDVAAEEYDLPDSQRLAVGDVVAKLVDVIVESNAQFDDMGFQVVQVTQEA